MRIQTRFRFSQHCSVLNLLGALLSLLLAGNAAADPAPASGIAKGTFAYKGEPAVALTNAASFVDVKDDNKPTLIIISDRKLPTEKWTSEFDMMEAMMDAKDTLNFSGVIFWIDKDGNTFRSDIYWKGTPSSVSGFFTLKLDSKPGEKEIKGSVKSDPSTDASAPKLDVVFHATLQ